MNHEIDDHDEIDDEVEWENNHEMVNGKAAVMAPFTTTGQGHGGYSIAQIDSLCFGSLGICVDPNDRKNIVL